jgi:transposase
MREHKCQHCESQKVGPGGGQCPNCIIGGFGLEIVMPLDGTWNDLERQLRGLKSITHQILNYVIQCEVGQYLAGEREQDPNKRDAVDRAYKYANEACEHWARRTGREGLYRDVPTGMLATIGRNAHKKFKQWKKAPGERLPQWKPDSPILLRAQEFEFDPVGLTASLKIHRLGSVRVVVKPVSGGSWANVQLLRKKLVTSTDAKIKYLKRKKKWQLTITVIKPRTTMEATPGMTVAVNRGRYNLLYAVANDGKAGQRIRKGEDVLEVKKRIRARKERVSSARYHRGSGARGHGRDRFFKAETHVGDIEANFVRSVCQQAAADLDRFCTTRGAGTVIIEDFTTIQDEDLRYLPSWPWYQLAQAVKRMCLKSGRRLIEVPSEYLSSECLCCGNVDVSQAKSNGVFHCAVCNYERPTDFVTTIIMLRRAVDPLTGEPVADMSTWEQTFERMRAFMEPFKGAAE